MPDGKISLTVGASLNTTTPDPTDDFVFYRVNVLLADPGGPRERALLSERPVEIAQGDLSKDVVVSIPEAELPTTDGDTLAVILQAAVDEVQHPGPYDSPPPVAETPFNWVNAFDTPAAPTISNVKQV